MGDQNIQTKADERKRMLYIQHLLEDVEALEYMLQNDLIETGITRIGAEQEFCLVDSHWRPAENSTDILEAVDDPHFTTELAKYNLEINLDPFTLDGDAFTKMETQLRFLLNKAAITAAEHGSRVVLSGILPTISQHELSLDYMTPVPRYYELNDRMKEMRTTGFHLQLSGVDELSLVHDTVMFEACCTSFQMHLQIQPDDFISSYNWAQAIAGPVLGICVNSPLLLGRELWQETRIALFQQSIDTRTTSHALTEQQARVPFGNDWVRGSVTDFYKNEISRYRIILSKDIQQNSMEQLKAGKIPKLKALNLHNGTIYRWNRLCYGVGGGKPHLRIECRYIPSGPSILDEMANFVFWTGLMVGRPKAYDDLAEKGDFKEVKSNFVKAARNGTESIMCWMGEEIPVRELVLEKLLPIAREGLKKMKINPQDAERFLSVIEQRTKGISPSKWMIRNYRALQKSMKRDDALLSLTKSIFDHQQTGRPIHEWDIGVIPKNVQRTATKIGHIMTTQLVTADEDDMAELTLRVMKWRNIHHVPVVDHGNKLAGLLTWTHIKRFQEKEPSDTHSLHVSDIMVPSVWTAHPSTPIREAIALMKKHEIGCLPVVDQDYLVGIVTIKDLIEFEHD